MPGFVADGFARLRRDSVYREKQKAVEAEIHQKHAAELLAAKNFRERVAVKARIRREIKQSKPSPYSLWISV